MSVIRVGSTSRYADGWEQIFGGSAGGGRGKAGTRSKSKAAAKGKARKAARGTAKKPTRTKAKAKRR